VKKLLPVTRCKLPDARRHRAALADDISQENDRSPKEFDRQFPCFQRKTSQIPRFSGRFPVRRVDDAAFSLVAVFTTTQRAFRAAVTQTDVLEGSRAAMDLVTSDLRRMTSSGGVSNVVNGQLFCPLNFGVLANYNNYSPLLQSLPGAFDSSGNPIFRTNVLNYFFLLGRENTKWIGIGYVVDNTSSSSLYPLYRYYAETNIQSNPRYLSDNFITAVLASQWTNMSHLMDGVVHLTVHAYDTNGVWINTNSFPIYNHAFNTRYFANAYGEPQFYMLSNTVPASVELELGVFEDRVVQHAQSLPNLAPVYAQSNYLAGQSGTLHLFRQRVSIPNVDPTAYQ
jgi:hypothetical protein